MLQGNFSISVLLRHEEFGWAAQCLEYDIAAQGSTLQAAKDALEKAFVSQIVVDVSNGNQPLADVSPAPAEYWKLFETAVKLADRKPFYIPPAYMIRAAAEETRIAA
ncbi:MAG: hypothetical protein ACYC93_05440 [Candidatus Acidiferrales bacterium]